MIRWYRSNPLDGLGRAPSVTAPLLVGSIAAVALAAYGLHAHRTMSAARAANVERFVAGQGMGPVTATARNRGCGRGRSLYDWEGDRSRGVACAGPRGWVELREVVMRPAPAA